MNGNKPCSRRLPGGWSITGTADFNKVVVDACFCERGAALTGDESIVLRFTQTMTEPVSSRLSSGFGEGRMIVENFG